MPWERHGQWKLVVLAVADPRLATVAYIKAYGRTVVNRGMPRSLSRHSRHNSNNVYPWIYWLHVQVSERQLFG